MQCRVDNHADRLEPGLPALFNVLSNDFDVAGEPLSLDSVLQPSLFGNAVIINNMIEYTPAPGMDDLLDSFVYQIKDSSDNTASATVYLRIKPVDNSGNLPIAVDDCFDSAASPGCGVTDSLVVDYGGSTTLDLLVNDSDPNGETININSVSASAEGASVSQAGNTLIYSAPAGAVEGFTDTFTYQIINQSQQLAQATVYVKVRSQTNNAPVGVNDNVIAFFNEARDFNVTANDFDEDYDPISIIVGSVTTPQPNGTATRIDANTIRFTPDFGQDGSASFQYQITDGKNGNSNMVTVNVTLREKFLLVPIIQIILDDDETPPPAQ